MTVRCAWPMRSSLRSPACWRRSWVLARMGVSMPQVEVALKVLFVAFLAMKRSRHRWDVVSEDLQEACMERLTARMRFNDGLPAGLAAEMVTRYHTEHPERPPARVCLRPTSASTIC